MNKKLLPIIAVVVLLIIAAGGVYYFTRKNPAQTSLSQVPLAQNNSSNQQSIQGTLKSLMTGGKSVSCTFTSKVNDTSVSGTVYASAGKMRNDFTSTTSQTTVQGHMIADSQFGYVWTNMSNQGMKFNIAQKTADSGTNGNTPNLDQKVDFSCHDWQENASLFSIPSNISFSEISLPSFAPSGSSDKPAGGSAGVNLSNQCAVCNNIPAGPGRDACKTQLNCK